MPNLTERAEQALLGALLIDPGPTAGLTLSTTDFASDLHAAAFYALQRVTHSGARAALAAEQAATVTGPGYAAELRRSCPDHRNAGAYPRMVMEAALRRQLCEHADRLQTDAAKLHYDLRRLERADSRAGITAGFPAASIDFDEARNGSLALRSVAGHQLKLAVALRSHATAFNPGRESSAPDSDPPGGPAAGIAATSAAAAIWHAAVQRSTGRPDPSATMPGGDRSDRLAAVVIAAHPKQGWYLIRSGVIVFGVVIDDHATASLGESILALPGVLEGPCRLINWIKQSEKCRPWSAGTVATADFPPPRLPRSRRGLREERYLGQF